MVWLEHIPIPQWQIALTVAIGASLCSGFAELEIRRNANAAAAIVALIFADLAALLAVPALSPPLVTGVSGAAIAIVVLVGRTTDKAPWSAVAAAVLITVGVGLVALDITIQGNNDDSHATHGAVLAFWVTASLCSVCTGVLAAHLHIRVFQIALMFGCGVQAVITTSLVYAALAPPANPWVVVVLLCSGLFSIYATRQSLSVNLASQHMGCSYAVYNFGIWFTAPAFRGMTIHGGSMSVVGTVLCIAAAGPLLCYPSHKLAKS